MRRDLNGIVDGEGIKRGDVTEFGVTIGAPLVIGGVVTPKASPNTLRSIGALPEANAASSVNTISAIAKRTGKIEIEQGRSLSKSEQRFADKMAAEGKIVKARAEVNQHGVKNPDFEVNGEIIEFKYVSDLKGANADKLSGGLSRRILDGGSQASKVSLDLTDQVGMSKEVAERAIMRAFGNQAKRGVDSIKEVRVYGKDFDFTIRFETK